MPRKLISKPPLRGIKLKICQCYYDNLHDRKLPPTFDEIARKVGLWNSSTVSHHINDPRTGLLKKGFISRIYGERKYRNYELTEYGIRCVEAAFNIPRDQSILNTEQVEPDTEQVEPIRGIPLLGTTAAAQEPRFIFGEPDEMIDIEHELKDDNIFAVCVRGNSMIGDHINDGDYVFVRRQSACANGDIVVVSHIETSVEQGLDGYGYATLKHFFLEKDDDDIHLRSSNPEVDDIIVPKQKWSSGDEDSAIESKEWQIEGKVIAIFRRLHSS